MTDRSLSLIYGIFWLGFAILSMMPGIVAPMPATAPETRFDVMHGATFGLFPVNMLLILVHLFIGAWGLAAFMGWSRTRFYVRSAAIVLAALGVMGLVPGLNTVFGVMPLHSHDVWLHLAGAAVAAYVGWREPSGERRSRRRDRRTAARAPIANERRQGLYDRRRSPYIPQA
jgi:Domain of unknown function (DUF4383)